MNLFSLTCEYAFRALAHLASDDEDTAVLGRDLAERANVPASYLSKILLTLKRGGIVEATRGTGGGYRLARPAAEIALAEITELLDPPRSPGSCFLGGGRLCSNDDPCPGHQGWRCVQEAYLAFIRETTLAQLGHQSTTAKSLGGAGESLRRVHPPTPRRQG
jgi:Rrf2 family protein